MPEGYFILADAGPSGYFILCAALMVVLQLVALVCGIVGWRTASGKAGIAISIVSLALVVLAVWSLITTTHSEKSAPTTTVTDTVQSSPTVQRCRARCRYRTKARREKYAPTGRSTPRRKAGRAHTRRTGPYSFRTAQGIHQGPARRRKAERQRPGHSDLGNRLRRRPRRILAENS